MIVYPIVRAQGTSGLMQKWSQFYSNPSQPSGKMIIRKAQATIYQSSKNQFWANLSTVTLMKTMTTVLLLCQFLKYIVGMGSLSLGVTSQKESCPS
jgi:hypothetical protein